MPTNQNAKKQLIQSVYYITEPLTSESIGPITMTNHELIKLLKNIFLVLKWKLTSAKVKTSVNPAWAISCLNKSHTVFNLNWNDKKTQTFEKTCHCWKAVSTSQKYHKNKDSLGRLERVVNIWDKIQRYLVSNGECWRHRFNNVVKTISDGCVFYDITSVDDMCTDVKENYLILWLPQPNFAIIVVFVTVISSTAAKRCRTSCALQRWTHVQL